MKERGSLGKAGRDAIHIAIAPVVAGEILYPGQDIGFIATDQLHVGKSDAPLGIVDPFLKNKVMPGERFWIFLYQKSITSLRHVWEHRSFAPEGKVVIAATPAKNDVIEAQTRIKLLAHNLEISYEDLMTAATNMINEDQACLGCLGSDSGPEVFRDHCEEFWKDFETVMGEHVPFSIVTSSYFRCAC